MLKQWGIGCALIVAGYVATPGQGLAANGLVSPGNGTTQLGLAGAGTALAEDAAATLRNPAAGAWLGNSRTVDLGFAVPKGSYTVGEVGPGSHLGLLELAPGREISARGIYPAPTFAQTWRINERHSWGVGFHASGLATESSGDSIRLARGLPLLSTQCRGTLGGGGPANGAQDIGRLCGYSDPTLAADLAQLFFSAYWAYRPSPEISIGVAPVLEVQRLAVKGLGAFTDFSNEPARTSDNGPDLAFGLGARLGLLWEVAPGVGLGLAYQSRIHNTEFDRYRGGVIGGAIDQPPIYDVGLQFHLAPRHRLLIDVQHIRYSDVRPLGNKVDAQAFTDDCFVPRLLGAQSGPLDACPGGVAGPGFGWTNMTIYKVGYQGQRKRLTWRAGFSYGKQPVDEGQVFSAVFAPAITERHAAVGLSWAAHPRLSLDWALVHGLKHRTRERNVMSSSRLQLLGGNLVSFEAKPDPDDQLIDIEFQLWQSQFGITWRFR